MEHYAEYEFDVCDEGEERGGECEVGVGCDEE